MQTLSNGVKKPEDGDAGNVWSDGLETNAEILNDTIDSLSNISIEDVIRPIRIVDNNNWVVDVNGKGYSQAVSLPGTLSLDKVGMRFRVTNGPKLNTFINPTIIPSSLVAFDIIVNDSSLSLEILFI